MSGRNDGGMGNGVGSSRQAGRVGVQAGSSGAAALRALRAMPVVRLNGEAFKASPQGSNF